VTALEFRAPWSRSLKTSTVAFTLALSAFSVVGVVVGLRRPSQWQLILTAAPPIGIVVASLFTIRGYVLTETCLEVKRLLWRTRLPLDSMQSIDGSPEAMRRAFAIAGNQGLFSYSGLFWSRTAGAFRALATDPSRAVLVRYPGKKIVITPHDPQQLIVRVRTLLKTSAFPR
jgi:hypothetical protein